MSTGFSKEQKLVLKVYKAADRNEVLNKIKVLMNPQAIKTRHENKYAKYRGINSSKNTASYAYSLAEEMSFTLLLVDSSALDYRMSVLTSEKRSVSDQLEEFMKACYRMNGDIHEPNFLKIEWGTLNFDCKLKTLDINYTSFDKDGKPRRAELEVVFVEDLPKDKIASLERKSSPDLTHVITAMEGDTLPLLTAKVYGASDTSLYIEVARVNQMNDFRNLKQGQRILFPPLENK
jgi:hypothetical protein